MCHTQADQDWIAPPLIWADSVDIFRKKKQKKKPLLTFEVALDPQVSHAETEDGQLVQTGADVLGERQKVRQAVQLPVQPIPVSL